MKNSFFTNIPKYNGIGVYALINNRSKKMYIGSSKNIHQRIMQHKATPPSALKSDIQQGDTFSVEILETLPYGCNQFDIFGRESFYISKYNTLSTGYNRAKTTCCTKDELLHSLTLFKNNSKMAEYIENIIAKRERPIFISI
ncbi:MAG: GIY-YIG nuclease family protein [Dorea sp.]|nr:GIY-YIG nuclease family protein [Dorea sp.]MDY2814585.1 GIY-YIG nuclease family protein [Dorea sp.]